MGPPVFFLTRSGAMRGSSEITKLNRELDALSFVVHDTKLPATDRVALRGEIDRLMERLVELRGHLSRS